jgi:hypothetical protein
MATTDRPTAKTTTKRASTAKRKPAARRSTAAKTASARRTTASTTPSTGRRPATRAEHVQQLAERAVLIPVGAALEVRDLAVTYRSRSAVEAQLTRFERRGGKARTELEREVRRTRSRIERQTRRARRELERQRAQVRRNLPIDVEDVTARVENVVQSSVDLGMKLVNGAQERFTKAA